MQRNESEVRKQWRDECEKIQYRRIRNVIRKSICTNKIVFTNKNKKR